ncbi:hypothetical protein [Bacillus chungangensis]|uniref:Major capsid protein n=1 Tax=Bacillus chungangensis TaxID=587633 RepID=A0ABT9WU43_9BACI|nr:hypothetical protein [Bacillus chungangensis]MDQ0176735.1 hypothetical protein [Bacillus chungangensis]
MAWYDREIPAVLMGEDLGSQLEKNGWNLRLKQRLHNGKNYAEVRLFESQGSDDEIRKLGLVIGYNKDNRQYGDHQMIPRDSPLGKIGVGDGEKTVFKIPIYPVDTTFFDLFLDTVHLTENDYTIDAEKGIITFNNPVPASTVITADYKAADNAIEPGVSMTVFTYHFLAPVDSPVDEAFGRLIDVQTAKSFDGDSPTSMMDAVFDHYTFMMPSPPTVISLLANKADMGRAYKRDSLFKHWGNMNRDRVILFARIDGGANADKAFFAPFYFGRLWLFGGDHKPMRNTAIFGGCSSQDEIKAKTLGKSNLDYGEHTTNGNSGVQLHQSIGGIYYQRHYFSFITHDISAETANGDASYNPSAYTDSYHLSRLAITHPNDGKVGLVDDVYATHVKSLSQFDELTVEEEVKLEFIGTGTGSRRVFHTPHRPKTDFNLTVGCQQVTKYVFNLETKAITMDTPPESGDEVVASYGFSQMYQFHAPTTPITPFLLSNLTPYHPSGIAILKKVN